jgi:AraC-like DNA-binding protein
MDFQILFAVMILTAATFSSLILILNCDRKVQNLNLLYASLFFYNFCLLIYYFWFEAGYITEAPHLLRTFSPFMYLCAPFFYLFIRNTIFGKSGLTLKDTIHFVPFLIHFLDLIPFYFQSLEVKSVLAETIVSDPSKFNFQGSGLIPIQFHYLFRIFLQTGYFVYAFYLVYKLRSEQLKTSKDSLPSDLILLFVAMGWMVFFQLSYSVFEIWTESSGIDLSGEKYIIRRISLLGLFFLNIYVNFKPGFLKVFGSITGVSVQEQQFVNTQTDLPQLPEHLEQECNASPESPDCFAQVDTSQYKMFIVAALEEEKLFKQNGMTLNNFASQVNLSPKLLSLIINREFGKGYNEFLNQYRIDFAISKIEEGYLDDYTLEALGEISGFNSRTTFFNAFKKEKGYSPSEYWKKFQQVPTGHI